MNFFFSVTKRANKRPWRSVDNNQDIIDGSERKFRATQCKECGIMYQICNPEDDKSPKKYHDNALTPKFTVCNTML